MHLCRPVLSFCCPAWPPSCVRVNVRVGVAVHKVTSRLCYRAECHLKGVLSQQDLFYDVNTKNVLCFMHIFAQFSLLGRIFGILHFPSLRNCLVFLFFGFCFFFWVSKLKINVNCSRLIQSVFIGVTITHSVLNIFRYNHNGLLQSDYKTIQKRFLLYRLYRVDPQKLCLLQLTFHFIGCF